MGGGVICPVRLGVPGHEDICQAELRVTGEGAVNKEPGE